MLIVSLFIRLIFSEWFFGGDMELGTAMKLPLSIAFLTQGVEPCC